MANKEFSMLIFHLKNRRGMFLACNDYDNLTSFLEGYFYSCRESSGINYSALFQNWLKTKRKKEFSFHWSAYILQHICNNDKEKSTELLLDYLQEFSDTL